MPGVTGPVLPAPGAVKAHLRRADAAWTSSGGVTVRVLVVDDDEAIRQLVEMTLVLEGHEVTTAADGRIALAVLDDAAPDVVVTDVMMPGLNGWELLAVLRADPARTALPVLILTARGAPDDVRRGRELGASALLAKPFEVDELLDVVASLAGRQQGSVR